MDHNLSCRCCQKQTSGKCHIKRTGSRDRIQIFGFKYLDKNEQFYLAITAIAVKLSLTGAPPTFLLCDEKIIRH